MSETNCELLPQRIEEVLVFIEDRGIKTEIPDWLRLRLGARLRAIEDKKDAEVVLGILRGFIRVVADSHSLSEKGIAGPYLERGHSS